MNSLVDSIKEMNKKLNIAQTYKENGVSEELLNAASPAFAVISCGEGNSYGHPHARTLNEFRQRGIQVFRTDEQGTIEAVTDGVTIKWNCSPSETWKTGN